MNKKENHPRIFVVLSFTILLFVSLFFCFIYTGSIRIVTPNKQDYPVVGVDVSSYQGEIDWDVLASQDISFAFIKATEGSSFVDPDFEYNYSEALKTPLRISAYHFFSYDSEGKTQAENFIKHVPITENMLPPVIDIEFYGDKERNLPNKQETQKQLDVLIEMLKEHYGLDPIIYATQKSYRLYISESYENNDIWIRNVYIKPFMPDGRDWVFWQYSDKGELLGYKGVERYIDLNVFNGSVSDFNNYAK